MSSRAEGVQGGGNRADDAADRPHGECKKPQGSDVRATGGATTRADQRGEGKGCSSSHIVDPPGFDVDKQLAATVRESI